MIATQVDRRHRGQRAGLRLGLAAGDIRVNSGRRRLRIESYRAFSISSMQFRLRTDVSLTTKPIRYREKCKPSSLRLPRWDV